ncbi:hypothetical protein MOVI109754_05995 [Moritella viscosa]|nr:hypothetical protein [Moritella viscosa]CED60869.1 putative uncharacterized protein [Moritella viscosa]
MIDLATKKRVLVQIDKNKCPYIKVHKCYEKHNMDTILRGKYKIMYELRWADEIDEKEGVIYFFGRLADPIRLQDILDNIELY